MQARTLVIYGAFGRHGVEKAISDWSCASVVEMDAFVPESLKRKGASLALEMPVSDHQMAATIEERTRVLLDAFLEERVRHEGLSTDRDFRAACLSTEGIRIISPYLLNLEMARRLASGTWDRIVLSPGTGVCTAAWRQLADSLQIPLQVLPLDRAKPPLSWMLRRKYNKWRITSRQKRGIPSQISLSVGNDASKWLTADPRLECLLAADPQRWERLPSFDEPLNEEVAALRERYLAWWTDWWQHWLDESPKEEVLSDRWILNIVGRRFCQTVYPVHAIFQRQARDKLRSYHPQCLLVGAMRGKRELQWLLAANEQGIPTGACTVDDGMDPKIGFHAKVVFCDDERHREHALIRGVEEKDIRMFRSHRANTPKSRERQIPKEQQRAIIVLADTFFSAVKIAAMPYMSLWAMQLLAETARRIPEHDFFIKFHPIRERPEEITSWSGFHHLHLWHREQYFRSLQPPSNLRLMAPEHRMNEVLGKVDLLLNIESYASFEAYALGVPVIHLASPCEDIAAFARSEEIGAARVARDPSSLSELILKTLGDPGYHRQQLELQRTFLREFYPQNAPAFHEAVRSAFSTDCGACGT